MMWWYLQATSPDSSNTVIPSINSTWSCQYNLFLFFFSIVLYNLISFHKLKRIEYKILQLKYTIGAFKPDIKRHRLHPRIPRLFSGKNWFLALLGQFKSCNASKYAKITVLLVWLFVVSFEISHLFKWTSYLWHQTVFWSKNDVRELYFFCSD